MAALVDYGSSGSSDEEENVVDLPVKPKDQRTLISVLSKQIKDVKDSSTKKGGVRIGLPSLHSKDDSDDEDSEKPTAKKANVESDNSGRSGLASLLPKPKSGGTLGQSSSKERTSYSKTVKSASLVPHTVRKRQQLKQTKTMKKTDGSSSEEEDNVPFFSHLEEPTSEGTLDRVTQQPSSEWGISNTFNPSSSSGPSFPPYSSGLSSFPPNPPPQLDLTTVGAVDYEGLQRGHFAGVQESVHYLPSQFPQYGDDPSSSEGDNTKKGEPAPNDLQMDQQALKRLMGGKNWKQNQKAINFTDLNEKELIQSGEHMRLVHSTEEMEAMVAQSALEKEVSGMAKRKHQITFLVSQAKSRELQLKNQWAQNRMSRRQTQMKYGF